MKKILVFGLIAAAGLTLAGCTSNSNPSQAYINNDPSVLGCIEGTGAEVSCVEGNIESITNVWVKDCIETNIGEKKPLVEKMNNNAMTTGDVKDIDELAKECINYFALQEQKEKLSPTTSAQNYPVFGSFTNSLAGSFLGSYLANSMFMGRMNYNMPMDYGYYRGSYEEQRRRGGSAGFRSQPFIGSTATSYERSAVSTKAKAATASSSYKLGGAGKAWVSAGGGSALG